MSATPIRVLVLYRSTESPLRPAIAQHLRAVERADSAPEVVYYNAVKRVPEWLRLLRFDAVILHTTWLGMRWSPTFPLWKWSARWLADVDCAKLALPQDEYDGAEILDEWLYELGVTDVFSVFDEDRRAVLYPLMHDRARFHRCLTGYVDEDTAARLSGQQPPMRDRRFDIVYRAQHLPYRFGRQGQLKHELGERVRSRAEARSLACDISTRPEDTIRTGWFEFLMSGRATIGCESGSSALDRRGELRAALDALDPALSFEQASARLPAGWDDYEFFAIGPRHLEAAMTKTAQILVEGRYDGVLEPERHYLPVRRDLADLDEVLERATDHALLERLAETAYEDVVVSGLYAYRRFAAQLGAALPSQSSGGMRLGRGGANALARIESAVDERKPAWVGRFLVRPRSSAKKSAVALTRAVSSPTLRRLVLDYVRDAGVRRATTVDRLLADVFRLGQLGNLGASLEDDGRVIRLERGGNGPADRDAIESALRAGRVTTIVWIDGVYRFEALVALARRFPSDAAAALTERRSSP